MENDRLTVRIDARLRRRLRILSRRLRKKESELVRAALETCHPAGKPKSDRPVSCFDLASRTGSSAPQRMRPWI